jgi:dephospho-CoA kinase
VAKERDAFLAAAAARGDAIVVLDIPLLFETGAERTLDAVVVASAPGAVQRARALARPGMSEEKFEALSARQMPDVKKRAKAHFVVVTDRGLEHAREQVKMILAAIREKIQKK